MANKLDVRMVRLEPMRVAYAIGFGKEPEYLAWTALLTWARQKGLFPGREGGGQRFFGFNNPSPTPGSPNYGYEQWLTVGPEAGAEGEVQIKDFSGGLYAVARCQGPENIYPTWKDLVVWGENSQYKMAAHQCLEECLSPELLNLPETPWEKVVFDLYLPVAE